WSRSSTPRTWSGGPSTSAPSAASSSRRRTRTAAAGIVRRAAASSAARSAKACTWKTRTSWSWGSEDAPQGLRGHGRARVEHQRLEFDTYENAKAYGQDLRSRWTAVREFAVVPVPPGFIG